MSGPRLTGLRVPLLSSVAAILLAACSGENAASGDPLAPSGPSFAIAVESGEAAGAVTFASRLAPAQCMTAPAAGASAVTLTKCDGLVNEQFTPRATGEIRTDTRCLDAGSARPKNGDPVKVAACTGGTSQRWTTTSAGELRGPKGRCVAVPSGSTADGTGLVLASCLGTIEQQWSQQAVTPPAAVAPAPTAPTTTPAPAPTVASVAVTPAGGTVAVGGSVQLSAVCKDSAGGVLANRPITWTASDTMKAKVSTSGLVLGIAAGTALVTASCDGKAQPATITVTQPAAAPAPTPTPAPAPAPAPTPSGVVVNPGESIQAKVNANPAGTTFILKAGVHANQSVVPKSGNSFIGETGAVMDGGRTTTYAFTMGTSAPYPSNVRIQGIEIRAYNPPLHFAPVRAGGDDATVATRGWVIERCDIHHNAVGGVRVGHTTRVLNNKIHHNGMLGVMGAGDSVLVEGNEIAYNNVSGIGVTTVDPAWGGGGMKIVLTRWAVIRNNFSHHNVGSGLWADINNRDTRFEGNRVEDNTHAGIFEEISYGAVIVNNTVARNGFGGQGWLHGAGILIAESPDVEVSGNTVIDNAVGIAGKQQVRGEPALYGPHVLERLWVHDNTVTLTAPRAGAMNVLTGIGQDVADASFYTGRGNRFDRNRYSAPAGLGSPFHWMDGLRTWSSWRTYGQDATGTIAAQ